MVESATTGLATQSSALIISTLSTSLLAKVPPYVNVLLATTEPFRIQFIVGFNPPLVGVAVNVALSPLHSAADTELVSAIPAEGALMMVT